MIEYGLIVGLLSVWVVIMFLALKPIFTEKFAADSLTKASGEGRVQLASNLGVSLNYTTAGDGTISAADDF